MMILCKGQVAKEPYLVPISDVPVYSLEELCYYIYNNIYTVTEEFFDERLSIWLREEVHLDSLAKKMRKLVDQGNDLKDLVVTLLCACDYYRENEIIHLVTIMEKIAHLPAYKRCRMRADNYLKGRKYGSCIPEYRKLLYGPMAENFSSEEYGDILHNQAIAQFYVASFEEAERGFRDAYARNQKEESLKHYLYVLLLAEKEEQFWADGAQYGKSKEELEEYKKKYEEAFSQCRYEEKELSYVNDCRKELRESFLGGGLA